MKRKQDDRAQSTVTKKTRQGSDKSVETKSSKFGKSNKVLPRKNLVDDSGDESESESTSDNESASNTKVELVTQDEDIMDETEDTVETQSSQNGYTASNTKSRDAHAAQKKLVQERKQAKPHADILQRSKKIWERLRRKSHVPLEERKALTDELFKLITGRVNELVFKHDASRVVQTAVKYGSAQRRQEIAKELKGGYNELAQSSYGKYLVVKLMHYGNAETRQMIVDELLGHVRKLIKHKEACFVIDDAYTQFATSKQKALMLREFYGAEYAIFKDDKPDPELKNLLEKSPDKRSIIMKSLFELISQVVEKNASFLNILHRAMLEYLKNVKPDTNEAAELIELIKEHVGLIAFTKDGSQVVMRCLAWGNAKDRKVLVKALKTNAADLYGDENGYMVLLVMFDVVDDTVLVSKTVFPEIQKENGLIDAATHKYARIPLLYPLAGREGRLLAPSKIAQLKEIDEIRATTSKKDASIRQAELRKALSPSLITCVSENAVTLSQDQFGVQFVTEVLLSGEGDKATALEAVAGLASPLPSGNPSIFRLLKTLVQGGFYNAKEKKLQELSTPIDFHAHLVPKIEQDLIKWATGEGAFVVVAILECDRVPEDAKSKFRKELGNNKKALNEAVTNGNKGTKLLLDLI